MTIVAIIIQLISGLVGGNAVGAANRGVSLGAAGNSILGAIGGLAGGQLVTSLVGGAAMAEGAGMDIGAVLTQVASGGLGGAALIAVIGTVKRMMAAR